MATMEKKKRLTKSNGKKVASASTRKRTDNVDDRAVLRKRLDSRYRATSAANSTRKRTDNLKDLSYIDAGIAEKRKPLAERAQKEFYRKKKNR